MECPYCGFVNIDSGPECAKCHRALPPNFHDEDSESIITNSILPIPTTIEPTSALPGSNSSDSFEPIELKLEQQPDDEISAITIAKPAGPGKQHQSSPDLETPEDAQVVEEEYKPTFEESYPSVEFSAQEKSEQSADLAPDPQSQNHMQEDSTTDMPEALILDEPLQAQPEQTITKAQPSKNPRLIDLPEPEAQADPITHQGDAPRLKQSDQLLDHEQANSSAGLADITRDNLSLPQQASGIKENFLPGFRSSDSGSDLPPGPEDESYQSDSSIRSAGMAAPLALRIFAGIFDLLIGFIILTATYLSAVAAAGISPHGLEQLNLVLGLMLPIVLVTLMAMLFYGTLFEGSLGQTPGKMIVGLRVVDHSQDSIDFKRAFKRTLIFGACLAPLGLGLVPILWDSANRGLHEKATNSRVIRA